MMSRSQMVRELIENDIECNLTSITFIYKLMQEGFKGYSNMTDAELKEAYDKMNGVVTPSGGFPGIGGFRP